MTAIIDRIQANPTGFAEIIRLSLLAAVTLGLHLSVEQILAIMAPVSLVLAFFANSTTTPVTKPILPVNTDVNEGSAVVASKDPPPEPTVATPPAQDPPPVAVEGNH